MAINIESSVVVPVFEVVPINSAIIPNIEGYKNVKDVVEEYEDFCQDCDRWGQVPVEVFVYYDEEGEYEEYCNLPDYPDLVIKREGNEIIVEEA